MKVYHKNDQGKLEVWRSKQLDHHEAILDVQEELLENGCGFNHPILVVIDGRKDVKCPFILKI